MVQVDLSRDNVAMTTWVEKKPNLARDAFITLKDIDETVFWKVEKVYDVEQTRDQVESNRNWDNNNYDKHVGTPLKDRK